MAPPETPLDDAAQSPLRPGDILVGKYRVERQIGRGGMGIVLAATHLQLEHQVAIKVLRRDLVEGDKALTRLFAEARAAAKIRSEHVARVLDVGTLENGAPFIVMEYLEGEDLADLLDRQGALDMTMAVQFLLQSCEALAEVHAAEMVHRDLKPGNLFVAKLPDGSLSLKIVDFGISKHIGGSARHHASTTTTSTVLGSPYYMPPEQMRAEPVDERSDIWSLGAILFEMLTGRPPFLGETLPEVYAAVLSGTVQSVSSLRPDIPRGLDDIVQRCLDKDPSQRFGDVAELADALGPYGGVNSSQSVERVTRILSNPELFRGRVSATPRAAAVEPVANPAAPGGASTVGGSGTTRGGMSLESSPLAPSPMLDIGPGSAPLLQPTMLPQTRLPPTVVTPALVSPAQASFGRLTGSSSPVELPLSATASPFTELELPQKKRGARAAWGAVAFAAVVVAGALWLRGTSGEPVLESAAQPAPLAAAPYTAEQGSAAEKAGTQAAAPVSAGRVEVGARDPAPRSGTSPAVPGSAAAPRNGAQPPSASTEQKRAAGGPPVVTVEALRPAAESERVARVEPERPPERKAPRSKPPAAASAPRAVTPRAVTPRAVTPRAVTPRAAAPRASAARSEARTPAPQNGSASPNGSPSKQKGNGSDPWNPSSFGDRR